MKLLHVDSSVLGENSVSRRLSRAIVAQAQLQNPGLEVLYRDLAAEPVAHTSPLMIAAAQGMAGEHGPLLQKDLAAAEQVVDEFLAADIVVIGAPMYNFTIPSQLKAWIDKLVVAGKPFDTPRQARKGWSAASASTSRRLAAATTAPTSHPPHSTTRSHTSAPSSASSECQTFSSFVPKEWQ